MSLGDRLRMIRHCVVLCVLSLLLGLSALIASVFASETDFQLTGLFLSWLVHYVAVVMLLLHKTSLVDFECSRFLRFFLWLTSFIVLGQMYMVWLMSDQGKEFRENKMALVDLTLWIVAFFCNALVVFLSQYF